ncbi:NAD dependent epimerase/dehydratase family protein [Colletotrichum tofieldiae]|uniref:NAD dependent epimerase/dehydratase family protein n=1 Tax=Colletotrichum tofieldiae TaxID=708197 RepID=A0A166ZEE6_9PEZI|nr:NAD dependent epimerase/dehydratase family protein [Colletotrichum tofieldiae]GKT55892.1 NAD dependent epimerase/dehydratase family protein [Colletotrichum tofieldiae]GKT79272.1 NAD dependent epimerase/dehydratase family protein [Colletotrichum tofieldiae]GKT82440.1 NAD dependent epimerase/dehydratase family protein [Colletotrichum tofieldiae]
MTVLSHEARSRIKLITYEFLDDPALIAKSLKPADWSEADTLVKSNVAPLKNFLESLVLADIKPTRFIPQTGGKNCGTQNGCARTPQLESDPQPRHLSPNFYYPQEDILKAFCEKNGKSWNLLRPAAVIGESTDATMNMFYLFAVYAAMQARNSEPLPFGGDWEQWQYEYYLCSARMTGYLTE